jgi:hypothetical protein
MCKNLSFEECELTILRTSIDKSEKIQGEKLLQDSETQKLIKTVEKFIKDKKCIVYGGTAINNILPEDEQFYNYDYELPDYDFFSPDALSLAKELADIYHKQGFDEVEAKAGVHHGTYKVFVNRMGVADITYLHKEIYDAMMPSTIQKKGILYAPSNFLRQSMYLELSRPMGDVSRWEKVLKRLNLLNKHYPLVYKKCELQRHMSSRRDEPQLFSIVKNIFAKDGVVFIGGYANAIYTTYTRAPKLQNIPDFDVLSKHPEETVKKVYQKLKAAGYNVTTKEYEPIGELVAKHYSISIDDEYVAFVYSPSACHSYNIVKDGGQSLKIGTIDTLLSYYLAFMYANREYYDENRLICLCSVLFKVQQENRLSQKGVLKRFIVDCYGKQPTLQSMYEENNRLYKTLKPKSKAYEERFLKYNPSKTRKKR